MTTELTNEEYFKDFFSIPSDTLECGTIMSQEHSKVHAKCNGAKGCRLDKYFKNSQYYNLLINGCAENTAGALFQFKMEDLDQKEGVGSNETENTTRA